MPPVRYKLASVTARITDQDNSTVLVHIPSERPAITTLPYLRAMPSFPARINGGYGECVLDVGGWTFDDFDEGAGVDHLNLVDLYANVVDEVALTHTSTRIYRGFLSQYTPYLRAGEQGVRLTFLGLGSLLAASKYGASPTYSVTHTTEDPETIARAVIDDFNSVFGGSLLTYSDDTTDEVGVNVTRTFDELSWFDALNETVKMAGEGWYWLLDASGQLYFQDRPSTAVHTLTLNRDIEEFEASKTVEKSRNEIVVVRNGGTRSTYTDASSQANLGTGSPATGRWTEIVSDSTIANATTADQVGQKKLADLKDPKVSARLTVNRNYPIDTIRPGECVRIANHKASSSFFGDNVLQIAGLTWQGETVALELEQIDTSLARELDALVNP